MKKIILLILVLPAAILFAQNQWNLVWTMDQMPFQPEQEGSEMAIVKAGFDTDEDGMGEFLCAYTDKEENYLLMYEATGDNAYDLVWYYKYPVAANTFAGIAVGDVDNNGVVEIVTTMPSQVSPEVPNPKRLWVFEWNGNEGENKYGRYNGDELEPTASWNFDLPDQVDFRPYGITIEDIDNDGNNEIIVGVRSGDRDGEVVIVEVQLELSGFGYFETEYNIQGYTGGSTYNVTTGDLDGDGFREIYAMVWNMFSLHIIECTGEDTYEEKVVLEQVYSDEGIDYGALDGIRVADVNDDGVNELYIAGTEPENTVFIITDIDDISNITADDVKELLHFPAQGESKLRSLYVADPDQDGKTDLMIAGERNGQIFDLEYKGEGDPADSNNWNKYVAFDIFEYSGFSPDSQTTIGPRLFYGHPADDMDGDGLNEYVFVNYASSFDVWAEDKYVFVIEADKETSVAERGIVPEKHTLYQNYPNPFNPATNISFYLADNEVIELGVYDITGSQIAVLRKGMAQKGEHNVVFDPASYNLAGGVYLFRLRAGTTNITKKMVYLK